MENNPNYEMSLATARRLFTFMARSQADPMEKRIAKEIFRWSSVAAGAAVVAVVVL